MLQAGADKVLWVQCPNSELEEALNFALSDLSDADVIIAEGNSPLNFLNFDTVIFVLGSDTSLVKDSGRWAINKADFVVININDNNSNIETNIIKEYENIKNKKLYILSLYNRDNNDALLDKLIDEVLQHRLRCV
ncbi:hypothetical protein MCHI_000859 [Candidatus Magnetoovum chiemensis]|nr:hypothetical protein MCHI_000859 [Candidatus Magnetoovum chiemensis]